MCLFRESRGTAFWDRQAMAKPQAKRKVTLYRKGGSWEEMLQTKVLWKKVRVQGGDSLSLTETAADQAANFPSSCWRRRSLPACHLRMAMMGSAWELPFRDPILNEVSFHSFSQGQLNSRMLLVLKLVLTPQIYFFCNSFQSGFPLGFPTK